MAERHQPGRDLIARIELTGPTGIVDLGCGTGRLTTELAHRWPGAAVIGLDRSTEMIAAAVRTTVEKPRRVRPPDGGRLPTKPAG